MGNLTVKTALKSVAIAALGLATTAIISGCSLLSAPENQANGYYPQTIDSPYGSAEVTAEPTKVATLSPTDLDIAVSLGVAPVIAGTDTGNDELRPWTNDALKDKNLDTPATFDALKGPDIEAIREADPDVILATGAENLGDDYKELSKIAPVVATKDDAVWTDKTAAIATALNKADEAKTVAGDITTKAKDVASSHLEFEDTTFTLADVREDSIDYLSYPGTDQSFFTGIGMLPAAKAEKYSAKKHSVSKKKVENLNADVLLIHFPDKGKGMLEKSELEDSYYREVKVIRGKHYSILDDDTFAALTNVSPLSYEWLLDEFPEDLTKAEQGVL